MGRLKCPECGNSERFYKNQYIEHHEAVINGDGFWVENAICYDSYFDDDGAIVTCPECMHEGLETEFEEE